MFISIWALKNVSQRMDILVGSDIFGIQPTHNPTQNLTNFNPNPGRESHILSSISYFNLNALIVIDKLILRPI